MAKGDVAARLIPGARQMRRIAGLAEGLSALTGLPVDGMASDAGFRAAVAEARRLHPRPDGVAADAPRLSLRPVPNALAADLVERARRRSDLDARATRAVPALAARLTAPRGAPTPRPERDPFFDAAEAPGAVHPFPSPSPAPVAASAGTVRRRAADASALVANALVFGTLDRPSPVPAGAKRRLRAVELRLGGLNKHVGFEDVLARVAGSAPSTPAEVEAAAVAALRVGARGGLEKYEVALLKRLTPRVALSVDPADAASVLALAHAMGRPVGRIPVVVGEATKVAVDSVGGVRAERPFRHSKDPAVDATLREAAKLWVDRFALGHVVAPPGESWSQAMVLQRPGGRYAAWVQDAETGRVKTVSGGPAEGAPRADRPLAAVAAEAAARPGDDQGIDLKPQSPDLRHVRALLPEGAAEPGEGDLTGFRKTTAAVAAASASLAVMKFRERMPEARRELLVAAWAAGAPKSLFAKSPEDGAAHGRLVGQVRALEFAGGVERPERHLRAIAAAPIVAKAMFGGNGFGVGAGATRVAIEAGASYLDVVRALAGDVGAPEPLPRAARSVAGCSGLGFRSGGRACAVDPKVLFAVADAVARAEPSRAPFAPGDLQRAAAAHEIVDKASGSRADAARDVLRVKAWVDACGKPGRHGVRTTVPGHGVTDTMDFVRGRLKGAGLHRDLMPMAMEMIFAPEGRTAGGLERISAAWHRSSLRYEVGRDALLTELKAEQAAADAAKAAAAPPRAEPAKGRDWPSPLAGPTVVQGVTVTPMLSKQAFFDDAREMDSCVANYRDRARTGAMLVYSLTSEHGRSTAGYWVERGGDGKPSLREFQHCAAQHLGNGHPSTVPPRAHVAAMAALNRSHLANGGAAVEAVLAERALHDASRTREERKAVVELSPERKARLAEADFSQARDLMPDRLKALGREAFLARVSAAQAERAAALVELAKREARAKAATEASKAPRRETAGLAA